MSFAYTIASTFLLSDYRARFTCSVTSMKLVGHGGKNAVTASRSKAK